MNPLQQFLDEIRRQQTELRARANKLLSQLGPVESYEAGNPIVGAIRELDWLHSRLEDMGESIATTVGNAEEFVANLAEQFGASAIAAAIADDEIVKKADHDAQITAAKKQEREAVETEFRAAAEASEKAEKRREKLAATLEEKVGKDAAPIAARCIALDDLKADDADARETKFIARAVALKDAGLDAGEFEGAYCDLLACALDDEGQGQFDKRLEAFKPLLARKPEEPTKPKKPGTELEDEADKTRIKASAEGGASKRMF